MQWGNETGHTHAQTDSNRVLTHTHTHKSLEKNSLAHHKQDYPRFIFNNICKSFPPTDKCDGLSGITTQLKTQI